MKKSLRIALLAAMSITVSWSELAAQSPTTEEIIQQLRPSSKSRSLKGITVENGVTETSEPSINLYINFEYNSAVLQQDAMIMLDRLAAALVDARLSTFEFLIGGHTDAKGGEQYNQSLSERRAKTVKDYLVRRHGVDVARLIEKGFGETRLLDASRPTDGINRRVQITTLTIPTQ